MTMLRILLIEDSAADARLVRELLADVGRNYDVVVQPTFADAMEHLRLERFDAALLDFVLPDGRGTETIAALRAAARSLPIIVLTGISDAEVAIEAVRDGADDFLVKGRFDGELLSRSVRYAIERRRATEALELEVAARNRILAVVSHDLRVPLQSIHLAAELIRNPDEAQRDRWRQHILRASDEMTRLIDDLLDHERLAGGQLRVIMAAHPVDAVGERVIERFAPLANNKLQSLTYRADDRLPTLTIDLDRVVQALGNLVANACKFTPAGRRIELHAAAGAHTVRFEVRDEGPGIAEDELASIFEPFTRGRSAGDAAGVGLGLSIARAIAEAHGGRLGVDSTAGAGSNFWLELPAA